MRKTITVLCMTLALSGCSIFGGKKTRLVPQAYMPDPPAILMKEPKKLHTIKTNNLTKTDTDVSVEGPK